MSASLGPQVGTGTSRSTMPGPADSFTRARMGGQYKTGRTGESGRPGKVSRPSRLLIRENCLSHGFYPHRADLEFGDLGVGIEPRVGEEVGGCFPEVEGDENLASGLALRQPGPDQHGAPAGGDPDGIAFIDAQCD